MYARKDLVKCILMNEGLCCFLGWWLVGWLPEP